MINIIMNGCNGKMGQTITGILKEDKEAKIVAGIDLYDGIQNDYPVFPSLEKCDVKARMVKELFRQVRFSLGCLGYKQKT